MSKFTKLFDIQLLLFDLSKMLASPFPLMALCLDVGNLKNPASDFVRCSPFLLILSVPTLGIIKESVGATFVFSDFELDFNEL